MEGSAPNNETGKCECPGSQVPSEDDTKCECPDDLGWLEGSPTDCVVCDIVILGSVPNQDTGMCECGPGSFLNNDTQCERRVLGGGVDPSFGVCSPGQGLINGICVDCNSGGQGLVDGECVDCSTALEGSAPNPDTRACECQYNQIPNEDSTKCEECPPNQIPSENGTKCEDVDPEFGVIPERGECPPGEGWVQDSPDECVDCNTVLEGSIWGPNQETGECEKLCSTGCGGTDDCCCTADDPDQVKFPAWVACDTCESVLVGSISNPVTGKCECPEGEIRNGKYCEKEQDETPKTTWCAIPCWEGYTNQAGGGGCDPSCPEGCSDAYCERVCPRGHQACDDTGNLDQNWFRCQLCSTIKSPNPKCNKPQQAQGDCAALRLDDVLLNGTSSDDGTGGKDCTDPTDCSEEDPTEMPSATLDMPSLLGSDSGSDAAAEETPSTTDRPSLPGSDSALDAAAEETPSTTGTPPLPGSDTPTVDAN